MCFMQTYENKKQRETDGGLVNVQNIVAMKQIEYDILSNII